MREPDIETDGWCLEDGEERHRAAPDTFSIPDVTEREDLQPGDFAKLIFNIDTDDLDNPIWVERMWVIVRERFKGGYLGVLNNNPISIAENDDFWSGIELPFSARHVIDISPPNDKSIRTAAQIPRRRWPTS